MKNHFIFPYTGNKRQEVEKIHEHLKDKLEGVETIIEPIIYYPLVEAVPKKPGIFTPSYFSLLRYDERCRIGAGSLPIEASVYQRHSVD